MPAFGHAGGLTSTCSTTYWLHVLCRFPCWTKVHSKQSHNASTAPCADQSGRRWLAAKSSHVSFCNSCEDQSHIQPCLTSAWCLLMGLHSRACCYRPSWQLQVWQLGIVSQSATGERHRGHILHQRFQSLLIIASTTVSPDQEISQSGVQYCPPHV